MSEGGVVRAGRSASQKRTNLWSRRARGHLPLLRGGVVDLAVGAVGVEHEGGPGGQTAGGHEALDGGLVALEEPGQTADLGAVDADAPGDVRRGRGGRGREHGLDGLLDGGAVWEGGRRFVGGVAREDASDPVGQVGQRRGDGVGGVAVGGVAVAATAVVQLAHGDDLVQTRHRLKGEIVDALGQTRHADVKEAQTVGVPAAEGSRVAAAVVVLARVLGAGDHAGAIGAEREGDGGGGNRFVSRSSRSNRSSRSSRSSSLGHGDGPLQELVDIDRRNDAVRVLRHVRESQAGRRHLVRGRLEDVGAGAAEVGLAALQQSLGLALGPVGQQVRRPQRRGGGRELDAVAVLQRGAQAAVEDPNGASCHLGREEEGGRGGERSAGRRYVGSALIGRGG